VTRAYRLTPVVRFFNALLRRLVPLGVVPGGVALLATAGCRTGRRHTTPVTPLEHAGRRYLVSPFGTRPWVLNVRASGEAELRTGRRRECVALTEVVDAATAGPVLRRYLAANRITADSFDATPDSPVEAFEAEAARHPVFLVRPPGTSAGRSGSATPPG